jgi:hypothetical protein
LRYIEEGNLGRKQAQTFDVESCVFAYNIANLDDAQNVVDQVGRRFGKVDILDYKQNIMNSITKTTLDKAPIK